MVLRYFCNAFAMKVSTNGIEPIGVFKISRHVLGVRKHGGSDMDRFNIYGDQITHFVG
jgi:hypothetical protein